ncbi:MAG TPA: SDR family oxidoreductase [Candidatus Dormibacteraeota bacterium]
MSGGGGVVMGASGVLGAALARRFAAEGWQVLAVGRDEGRVQAALEGVPASVAVADVLDARSVDLCVQQAVAELGRVDVLVNASGGSLAQLGGEDKPVTELTDADWRLVLDVNLRGSFNCVRAAGRVMAEQREGHIILVASGSGLRPGGRSAAYAAAKAGVIGLMKGAARDLGPFNVRVNAVNPGLIPHERMPAAAAGRFLDSYKENEAMLGRFSTPEEFARLVVVLAGASHLSGQVLNLDSRVLV